MKYKRIVSGMIIVSSVAALIILTSKSRQRVGSKEAKSVPLPSVVLNDVATSNSSIKLAGTSPRSSGNKSPSNALAEESKIVSTVYGAPITFYGRVVDQNGIPISDVRVEYGAIDKFFGSGSNYKGKSDVNGYFSIDRIHGAGLTVGVWKEGYGPISGKSSQIFGYGMGPDSSRQRPPTKDNPAIFILRKKAEAEPLLVIESRQYKVLKDGTPYEISLRNARHVLTGQGDLRIERWADEPDAERKFDWKVRVSVPGGGLIERNSETDFEAPPSGYKDSFEISMPKAINERWKNTKKVYYFLKLKDGTFARVDLMIYASFTNSLVLDSYLNPSGSRNLEFDTNKQIQLP